MPYIAPYRSQFRPYNRAYAYPRLTAFASLSMAVSEGNPPLDECLAQVARSAALVAVVAQRHGWVAENAKRNPRVRASPS